MEATSPMYKGKYYPSDVAACFQGEPLLRPHRGRGEEVSREPVRAGLRPRALVRVVSLLYDVRYRKEDEIEASPLLKSLLHLRETNISYFRIYFGPLTIKQGPI